MTKPGHIRIVNNEIRFEYHELKKPNSRNYLLIHKHSIHYIISDAYYIDLKAYEASKRKVEVENWLTKDIPNKNCSILLEGKKVETYIRDSRPCEAEVEDNKAIIQCLLDN